MRNCEKLICEKLSRLLQQRIFRAFHVGVYSGETRVRSTFANVDVTRRRFSGTAAFRESYFTIGFRLGSFFQCFPFAFSDLDCIIFRKFSKIFQAFSMFNSRKSIVESDVLFSDKFQRSEGFRNWPNGTESGHFIIAVS